MYPLVLVVRLFKRSLWLISACAVWSRLVFGLSSAFSCLTCLNQPRIRTLLGFFTLYLSEPASYSDSPRPFPALPVRISLAFGLSSAFSRFSCPNQPRIRTLLGLFTLYLSELASHSDSPRSFPASSVRIGLSSYSDSSY